MNTIASSAALLALTGLAIWTLGGLLLRSVGALGAIAGLTLAAGGRATGLAVAFVGATAWVAGQHLHGMRHHTYRSPLARRLYTHTPLAHVDTTRGWAVPLQASHRRSPAGAPTQPAAAVRTDRVGLRRPDPLPTRRTRHDH